LSSTRQANQHHVTTAGENAGHQPLNRVFERHRFRKTCKDEVTARIELGRLLAQAQAGKQAESTATVGQLLDRYLLVGDWDVATREGYEGYIRRTIRPAFGHVQVRKVRGPMLDMLYARLRRCGDLACIGRPFTEHRNVPRLVVDPADGRPAWQQVADGLREAIQSGALPAGSAIPSVRELHDLQGIPQASLRSALSLLADEGLIMVRQGRGAVVADEAPDPDEPGRRLWRPGPGHDCALSGCRQHECRPMKAGTIRQIHSILPAAFEAAQRWEWTDRNPAHSARLTTPHGKEAARSPARGRRDGDRRGPCTGNAVPWNPDWVSHKVSNLAEAAGVDLNVKKMRHYTASQLLAGGFDLQPTAARLGHAGGGSTTLRHYADPVPEVDRRGGGLPRRTDRRCVYPRPPRRHMIWRFGQEPRRARPHAIRTQDAS
jgi:integrase